MARPKFKITDEILQEVERLASTGATKKAIAEGLGICYETLRIKKRDFSAFSASIERGEALAISKVENALFKNATENGNTQAQIFFLKNRNAGNWSDKTEVDTTVKMRQLTFDDMFDDVEILDPLLVITKDTKDGD